MFKKIIKKISGNNHQEFQIIKRAINFPQISVIRTNRKKFTCNQRTFFQHDNQHKHNQIRATENAQKQRSKCRRVSHEN